MFCTMFLAYLSTTDFESNEMKIWNSMTWTHFPKFHEFSMPGIKISNSMTFHDHMNLYTDCSVSRIMQSSHEGQAQMPGIPITCMYPNSYHHSVFPRLGSPIFKLLKVSNIVLISQEDNAIRLSGPSHYSPDPSSSLTWFPRVLWWRHMAWKWGPQLDKDLQDAKINQCYSTVWT